MMVGTIGDAYDLGWRVIARCAWGRTPDGLKQLAACAEPRELDLATLVWTRGRAFPLTGLESRLKCPSCGSRRVTVLFEPPTNANRATTGR